MNKHRVLPKPAVLTKRHELGLVKGGDEDNGFVIGNILFWQGGIYPGGSFTLIPVGTRAAWVWTPDGWQFTLS